MTKKIVACILFFCMMIFPINAKASDAAYNTPDVPLTMIGYLESDTGEIVTAVGYLVEEKKTSVFDLNTNSVSTATYEFSLYSNQNYELSTNSTDGSIAVRAYLTIYYSQQDSTFLLTKVSGSWTILDPRTSVTSAYLNYGCSGLFGNQDGHQYVSNNFSVPTGFTTYQPDASDYIYVGANLKLDLQIALTRNWSFTIVDNLR